MRGPVPPPHPSSFLRYSTARRISPPGESDFAASVCSTRRVGSRADAEELEKQSSTWRVVLFRALRDGDLLKVQWCCERHPAAIHENFTRDMNSWELEWDSTKWFEFLDSTCLYIATLHSHAHVVEWLLDNGVDVDTKCYAGQVAADSIGEARYDEEAVEKIKTLRRRPKQPPKPRTRRRRARTSATRT